jgi:hypothetical protein
LPRHTENIGARERAAVRRDKALDMRVTGKSYRAIGKALGVSHVRAMTYVREAMAQLAKVDA